MDKHTHSKTAQTHERILKAATMVFSESGVIGATTREIARVAGVNEVTLFRHFQSKEQLLGAVVQRAMTLQMEVLSNPDQWTQNLYTDLSHYAQLYNNMLEAHEALIRTFIGEGRRHPEAARQVISDAARPLRDKLMDYLRRGIERGIVRPEIEPAIAVDQFTGLLLSGLLRRTACAITQDYDTQSYIESCVDLFVRGIRVGDPS